VTPEEVLIKASEEMARTGHTKGNYCDPFASDESASPVCAYGAMARAVTEGKSAAYPHLGEELEELVNQAAALLAGEVKPLMARLQLPQANTNFALVTTYNDMESTTGEDVILAMKRAGSA
jgi:hypothetical protein